MATPHSSLGTRASANLRLFGSADGDSDAAPWFKPERLKAPDFSVDAYIAELRQFVPLESLSQELEAYLGTLKSKLVEVINKDYNDFVSLSTKLVNVDGAVLRMSGPLQEVLERLGSVHAGLQKDLDALGEALRMRQETAAARALLELMQDTAHTMSKVESLLTEIEAGEEEGFEMAGESLDNRCRMLERLASEVSRLGFYAAKGKDLPFVQNMEPRMAASKQKLQIRLSAALKAALVEKHASARQHCLLAFASISDTTGAEQGVRAAVVGPLVGRILEEHPSTSPHASNTFPKVLEAIIDNTRHELGDLLQSTMGTDLGLQNFNFLGNSLLAEVDQAVPEKMPGAFTPGAPSAFFANHQAAMRFLDSLEAFCSSLSALTALRSSAAYKSFTRRWKVSIYFSTRFQEVAGELENAISTGADLLVKSKAEDDLKLQLTPSQALVTCLRRVASEEVFLRPLADKFCRLAMQLLARYVSWLKQSTADRTSQPNPDQDVPDGWGTNTPVELLASARADVDELCAWLQQVYVPDFTAHFNFIPDQEALNAALAASGEALKSQAGTITASAIAQLSDRCSAGLSQLRGITAMYRMSTRPSPTRPSHYVSGILGTLNQFLETQNAKAMQEEARSDISHGVVAAVSERFRKMAAELLETLRKTETSLKRIRQNRALEGNTGTGGPTDIDKISLQLFLDVQEFGRQAARFNVSAETLSSYQALWKAVAPNDKAEVAL